MLSVLWRTTGQGSKDFKSDGYIRYRLSSPIKALPTVDVCILPYNLLLVPSARESCGIDLTNSVVIIDEAHNLAGAIESSYSNILGLDSQDISLLCHRSLMTRRLRGSDALVMSSILV